MTRVKSLLGGFTLAIILALCMSGVAFAANDDYTITVESATSGSTYTAYKMLNLESYNEATGAYSYTVTKDWEGFFSEDYADYDKVKNYLAVDAKGYVTWQGGDTVEAKEQAAKELAALAMDYVDGKDLPKVSTKEESGVAVIDVRNLGPGYYLVDSTTGSLCGLTTTNPKATLNDKSSAPTLLKYVQEGSKFSDKNTMDRVGDTASFKTEITVGKGAQNYKLTEILPSGLNDNLDAVIATIKVTKKSKDDTSEVPLPISASQLPDTTSEKGFVFDFENAGLTEGDVVTITFEAVSKNLTAGEDGSVATATLEYGEGMSATASTTTYSYAFKAYKYTGDESNALSGAVFALKNSDGHFANLTGGNYDYEKFFNGWNPDVTSIDDIGDNMKFTSGSLGYANVWGIAAGEYTLIEVEAPRGYNKIDSEGLKVTLREDGVIAEGNSKYNGALMVLNNTGSILPSTGGMGTIAFTVVGLILIVGAGALLVSKLRAKRN